MKYKQIWFGVLALLLFFSQFAIDNSLGFLDGKVNLILVALIVMINLADFSWAVAFAVGAGLLLDVYSGLPFGIITLSLFLTAACCGLLFINFFTNFSFYSLLILGLLAAIIYHLILSLLVVVAYFIGLSDFLPRLADFFGLVWQIVSTEILLVAAYGLINYKSRSFKPIFLK
jgi:hypothetical protein